MVKSQLNTTPEKKDKVIGATWSLSHLAGPMLNAFSQSHWLSPCHEGLMLSFLPCMAQLHVLVIQQN